MAEEKEKPWLKARMIIEIAGFPKEHVDKAITATAENFAKETKQVKVTNKKIRDAQSVKIGNIEKTKMFSGFVEIEADIQDISTLIGLIFDWMPSSVEIIEPEKTAENTRELSNVLNDLAGRLHLYDSAVKKLKAKTVILTRELAKYKKPEAPEPKKDENKN